MKRNHKKTIWKKIFRVLFFLGVGIFCGYQIYMVNAKIVGHTPLPMPFGYGQAVVMSGSMSPAFEVDALLIYHEQEEYHEGDMVAFLDQDKDLVTHRIIQINGDKVVTKGDANSLADSPIIMQQIYGKVIYIIPHVGKIIRILQEPMVLFFLIAILLAGLEWNYRQKKVMAHQRMEEQRKELEELRRKLENQGKTIEQE